MGWERVRGRGSRVVEFNILLECGTDVSLLGCGYHDRGAV